MKFVFTDKKVNLPNYIHNYAEKKVGKLDRFFKEDATAALTFSIEKDRNQVEVTIRSSGTIFRVSESTADMRASIDAAVASLERQIRKNKTRLEKRLRQGAFERTVDAAAEISSFVPDEPEEGEYKVVRTKTFAIIRHGPKNSGHAIPSRRCQQSDRGSLLGSSAFRCRDRWSAHLKRGRLALP